MLTFILPLAFVICNLVNGAPPAGRSTGALQDICQRFPWLNPCQKNQPVEDDFAKTFPPEQDFCSKYKSNYGSYCRVEPSDNVIKEFCKTYETKCEPAHVTIANSPHALATPAAPQHFEPLPPPVINMNELKQYCQQYKTQFALHCVNRQIASDGQQFCYGYSTMCPGSPDPGTVYTPNSNSGGVRGSHRYSSAHIKAIRQQIENEANSAPIVFEQPKPKGEIDWSHYSAE